MRIDFSEPECSNCFHCCMLNTQESEPSNVIASSVNSTPVNSEPVQALEQDSAAVASTSASTSSPVQALEHDSAAVGSTSTSSPIQTLGHDSTAVGSTSTSSPVQALGHDESAATGSISSFSFGPQTPSAPPVITSVCSKPVQTLAPSIFRSNIYGSPFPTTSGSGASATSPFGSAPAVTSVNSAPTTQAFDQNTSAFGCSPNSFGSAPAVTSVSSAPTTQAFGQNTSAFGCSPNSFGFTPAVTSVSSAPTQAFGQNSLNTSGLFGPKPAGNFGCSLFAAHTQPTLGSTQAPVAATFGPGASDTSPSPSFLPFGSIPAPPTNASPLFGPMQDYPRTGVNRFALHSLPSNPFGQNILIPPTGTIPAPPTNASSLFGPMPNSPWATWGAFPSKPASVNPFGQNIPIPPTGSYPGFPGYGVDYLSGSKPNPFGQRQNTSGGGGGFSVFASPKTSPPPQPFAPFSSNPSTGFNPFRAPTVDGDTGGMFMSVSASTHSYKSHEELRWEDYQKGNKGTKTNTVFGSPPIFASPSVPVHPQRPTFGTSQETFTGPAFTGFGQHNPAFTGFGTQFPSVSSPASGCTACGATTSTSASGNWTFNGATFAPPSAATTSLPGLFYPMYGSVPMMFGTSPAAQVTGSVPMMFGTSPAAQVTGSVPMIFGTSPAAQVTTPALQPYPVNGYILLPFAAMNLH